MMLSLPRRAFRVITRSKLEYLAPIAVALAFVFVQCNLRSAKDDAPRPIQPVVIVGTTPQALLATRVPTAPAMIRIVNLDVQPRVITIGEPATLFNGICNDTLQTLNVQLYLGAQREGDPITAPTVDFIGKDTPEGRLRRYIEPGCLGADPITSTVDDRLTPGKWRLNLVVMVTGDPVPIVQSSPLFEVRPAR